VDCHHRLVQVCGFMLIIGSVLLFITNYMLVICLCHVSTAILVLDWYHWLGNRKSIQPVKQEYTDCVKHLGQSENLRLVMKTLDM